MSVYGAARKVTTHTLQEMKRAGEKITMLTAYDYSLARLVDQAGVDLPFSGWRLCFQRDGRTGDHRTHDPGPHYLPCAVCRTSR